MGVWDAIGAIRHFDVFDVAIGVVDWVEAQLERCDLPIEFHPGTRQGGDCELEAVVKPHFFDAKGEMMAELAQARELIREAERLAIGVLANIP